MRAMSVGAAFILVLGAGGGAAIPTTTISTPAPSGLTERGRVLWQFEALLHDTFGNRSVCVSGRWRQRFTSSDCTPLAVYSPYDYVFAHARGSAFHISAKAGRNFGNYPQPVLIRGMSVACNSRETTFLVVNVARAPYSVWCSRAG